MRQWGNIVNPVEKKKNRLEPIGHHIALDDIRKKRKRTWLEFFGNYILDVL